MASRWGSALAGAGAGAATGAGIGGLAAGVSSGGLLAPAGAGIGAGIGGLLGGLSAAYAHGGSIQPGGQVSQTAQQRALSQMTGGLDQSRQAVLGGYDEAIRRRQLANAEAIRQMRMGIAAPAAGTLAGSGAAGLLGSGAAQASGRQAALTAGLERETMLRAGAEEEARILQQKAAQQMGFAEADLAAMQQRMTDLRTQMEAKKDALPLKGDWVEWLVQQRGMHQAGSAEYEMYNNELILVEPNWFFSG